MMLWVQIFGTALAMGGMAAAGHLLGAHRTRRHLARAPAGRVLAAGASKTTTTQAELELSADGMRVVCRTTSADGQQYEVYSSFTTKDVERIVVWWQRQNSEKGGTGC